MKTTTSRRAILAGAAFLPVLAIPAVAGIGPSDDTELLKLSVELECLIVEYLDQRGIDRAHMAAWEAACVRAGLPHRVSDDFPDIQEWRDFCDERFKIDAGDGYVELEDENGCGVWDHLHDRMYRLCDHILALKAQTVADLGIRARAASLTWHNIADDEDLPGEVHPFIDSVSAFCGVQSVAADEAVRLAAHS